MSIYDKNLEDYLEEEYLNKSIDDDNEKEDIENIINKYFNKETIKEYTNSNNKEYLDFLFQKIIKDDKDNDTIKYEQKNNYLELLKKTYFQNQSTPKDKVNFLIFYLKNKYSVITGKSLYEFFSNIKGEDDENMDENDYKNFILMNFNKETINLNNKEEEETFTNLLIELID